MPRNSFGTRPRGCRARRGYDDPPLRGSAGHGDPIDLADAGVIARCDGGDGGADREPCVGDGAGGDVRPSVVVRDRVRESDRRGSVVATYPA